MARIKINGAEFYYEVHGDGYPLVLISGYSGHGKTWLPIVSGLSKYFKVILFDNRGCGETIDGDTKLSVALMASDVIELCRALNLNKPHIIGRSMGGAIVQYLAANYPEEISKIGILVSTSKWRMAILKTFVIGIKMQEQNVDGEIIRAFFESWLWSEKFLTDAALMEAHRNLNASYAYPQSIVDQKRQYEVFANFDGRDSLTKIKAPTFIGYGKEDIIVLPQDSVYLASKIKNSKLVGFNCAHMIAIEATEALVNELINFFY